MVAKAVMTALEDKWGPSSEVTKRTRTLLCKLVGRDETKASLWGDRGGSLRDWRRLYVLLPNALKNDPEFAGLPLQTDPIAREIITLVTEIFAITYSRGDVDQGERCCRTLSLFTRGYKLGKLCLEQ